jgi:hypothetical protein
MLLFFVNCGHFSVHVSSRFSIRSRRQKPFGLSKRSLYPFESYSESHIQAIISPLGDSTAAKGSNCAVRLFFSSFSNFFYIYYFSMERLLLCRLVDNCFTYQETFAGRPIFLASSEQEVLVISKTTRAKISNTTSGEQAHHPNWTQPMFEFKSLVRWPRRGVIRGVLVAGLSLAFPVNAGPVEQAKRLHERIAGVPPSDQTSVLNDMQLLISQGQEKQAAYLAMENDNFYNVTLINWAAPWTNRDQSQFVPFNDYTATVVGLVRDNLDFRGLLFDDVIYVGSGISPAYSNTNNAHYEVISEAGLPLQSTLVRAAQSQVTGLPAEATAGVITSRAASQAFFRAGTNRAQLRFTLLNHLCLDLEQLHDVTRAPDRIRQDVSRSPGGDSRAFLNGCLGCHSGMDPLAQAFAYYNFSYDADNDLEGANGFLEYNREGATDAQTGTRVQAKYHINSTTFRYGYVTPDDKWDNYWRTGVNASLGWDPALPAGDYGAKSLGRELAYSDAFSRCQATKVFNAMCFREPETAADRAEIADMITNFQVDYSAKSLFADAAVYCMGEDQQ